MKLSFSASAIADLKRLRAFLDPKNPTAAGRAAQAIRRSLAVLEAQPRLGRQVAGLQPEFREWAIAFGASGYIARYHLEPDRIVILAIRHQREAGFDPTPPW